MSDGEFGLSGSLIGGFGGDVACIWVTEQGDKSGWSPTVMLD